MIDLPIKEAEFLHKMRETNMLCTACLSRATARRRGGVYQLGALNIKPCAGCVKSHDAYCNGATQIKGKK